MGDRLGMKQNYIVTSSWRCDTCFVCKDLLKLLYDDVCISMFWFKVVASQVQKEKNGSER